MRVRSSPSYHRQFQTGDPALLADIGSENSQANTPVWAQADHTQEAGQSSSLLIHAAASSSNTSLLSAFEVQHQSDEAKHLIAPRRIGVGRRIEQLTDESPAMFWL
jgi:hypothetical protein